MPTLPDGTTVSSEFGPEGWESIGKSFPNQQIATEGWESPIFIMSEFTAGPESQTVEPGGTATVSGKALDESGNPAGGGIPFTAELRDENSNVVDSATGKTASDGSYAANLVPPGLGTYTATTANNRIGRQGPAEDWENIGVTFDRQIKEGWEK